MNSHAREPGPRRDRVEKTERLLNLVSCLLAARTPVPFSQIRGRVVGYDDGADPEAMEKRFDRDKAELRALGVPIEYVAMDALGNSGYCIRKDRYFLPEIQLSVDEALLLAVLHRMATEGGAPIGANLLSALQKVSTDSPIGDGLRTSMAEQHAFGLRPGRGGREEQAALQTLTDAVLEHRTVKFRYYGITRDQELDRTVEPWGLGYHGGHWYLVGRDCDREAERTFRVDRIRGRVKTGRTGWTIPDDFDVQDRIGRPNWDFDDGRRVKIRIRFAPAIAWMVKENLRTGERFAAEKDGGGVLSFEATSTDAVLRFALKHGRLARIVAPTRLATEASQRLKAVRDRHAAEPVEPEKARSVARKRGRRRGRSA